MTTVRLILGDQLSRTISSLEDCDPQKDIILICEVMEEASYVKHHKKKIAFLFSAMRHFAKELQESGCRVKYLKLEQTAHLPTLYDCLRKAVVESNADHVVMTQPGEFRLHEEINSWSDRLKISVEIRADNRFLCSIDEFENWSIGRKQLRMEYFYREMRKKYRILMDGEQPEGGRWNFDSENRKPPSSGMIIPQTFYATPDEITKDVIDLVSEKFDAHFGDLEPFHFAVTREQALVALKQFIDQRLACFGDYQDAMIEDEPWMYHSHISFYLNCGLLLPLECVELAERAYKESQAPLNAVEGFIRQIIGWREYVRGIYWLKMPEYKQLNFLEARRNLPEFYWNADSKMNCINQCVTETSQNAYAHHIQRLMVLGNFALLCGVEPKQLNEWFLIVYADAYEWVEMPNVSGMILFADGGYLASKPYAAGGSYIHKMSNYCQSCSYNVKEKTGPQACPFNYLYWNFLVSNRDKLSANHRLGMMFKTYDRMDQKKKDDIKLDSQVFLEALV